MVERNIRKSAVLQGLSGNYEKLKKGWMRRMGKKYRINEDRVHFTLSIPPETMQLARDYYQIDDCGNISEYIGKAIEFYSGYVANRKTPNYLPTIVISTLKNILACSDDRRGAQLYRIAVELSVLLNIIAATNHFSKEEVRELRESCEEEVKRLNGTLRLDDAVRWQNS